MSASVDCLVPHSPASTPYLLINRVLPPGMFHRILPALKRLPSLADVVMQEPELARDEGRGAGVAGPGGDVDDVEGLDDEIADGEEVGEDEGIGDVEGVGCGAAGGREAREAEVDVLSWVECSSANMS